MNLKLHFILGWTLVIITLGLVGFWVPPAERVLGESYLIFFFPFPSAINCLNFFILAGIIGIFHLVKRTPRTDFWGASAVEVGVLACTITLVTGSTWARAAWGIWWDMSDKRLMTVAAMWLTYCGYLALRAMHEEPVKRGRFCAVFTVIAMVNVPLVYFSIRWFGVEHHPMEVTMNEPSMIWTRWFGVVAFLVLYTAFWRLRFRALENAHRERCLEEDFARAGI